jgi:broad specificity phosphatase PhoE
MPEPLPLELKNSYYLLRHGQSTANVAQVISSDRMTLAYTDKHDVTPSGYQQGKDAASQLLDALERNTTRGENVVFVSSPFARARSTARACLDGLQELDERVQALGLLVNTNVVLDERLMERFFGRLDDEAIYTYSYVWPLDKFNVTHTAFGVESVAAVCTRLHELVTALEETYERAHIVCVSHADVLQIAQLYAARADNVGAFSSYRFRNGEVRSMILGTTAFLPEPSPLLPPERGTKV